MVQGAQPALCWHTALSPCMLGRTPGHEGGQSGLDSLALHTHYRAGYGNTFVCFVVRLTQCCGQTTSLLLSYFVLLLTFLPCSLSMYYFLPLPLSLPSFLLFLCLSISSLFPFSFPFPLSSTFLLLLLSFFSFLSIPLSPFLLLSHPPLLCVVCH